ncbi:phosphohistidine phosphatase SixA [Desulfurobacterium atlanticum]|uniref:Phosphohistidine phosphatase, SixA n=1 Tax=Desulfurobacterium atlanticum TaxID=240169 RepID=A0A238YKU8_9BACT|nr:phosphohistidine phosphatase SixA [Desulfurobacterium atlanticum]SNR71321.1 phosphohistidine phosphatase, SixA [Desulfurobacterium atlanticum]
MRKIFLIRHGKAVDREEWIGDDCKRPLTEEGEEEFREFAQKIKYLFPDDFIIVSSPCERALKTAQILKEITGQKLKITELLKPDAEVEDYLEVLEKFDGNIAIVAHEPDLSIFMNELLCINPSRIKFKKGGVAKIIEKKGRYFLSFFITPQLVFKLFDS